MNKSNDKKMKAAKIAFNDYLPSPKQERKMIQPAITLKTYDDAMKLRKKHGITWQDLIEGLLKAWIDSEKRSR